MKKLSLLSVLIGSFCFCYSQTIINTLAGDGTATYSGDGGPSTAAGFNSLFAGCIDDSGNIYLTDVFNNRIRKVNAYTGIVTTVAGNGTAGFSGDGMAATNTELNEPEGIAIDTAGNLYIGDSYNNRIRKVTKSTGLISTIAGNGGSGFSGDGGPATNANFDVIIGVAVDDTGNVYITDHYNGRIRKVTIATGIITTIAGGGSNPGNDGVGDGGPGTGASLNQPDGIAVDDSNNVYIADQWNFIIRKVSSKTGTITCIAGINGNGGYTGDGGLATSSTLLVCSGVAVDAAGNVFIADTYNNVIRKVTKLTGIITTIAGDGFDQNTGYGAYAGDGGPATAAELDQPYGVTVDACGNVLSLEYNDYRARLIYIPDSIKVTPNPATTCSGSVTLTATGAANYVWSPSNGLSDSTAATVTANPTAITAYTISTLNSCSGWLTYISATDTVSVGNNPIISVQPTIPAVCNGQSVVLTASGGKTYQWVGTSDTTDSINVTPTKDTTYELKVSNGSCIKDTFIAVTVNALAALNVLPQNPFVCGGTGITLSGNGNPGDTYTWTPATGLNASTGDSVIANPTATITYTVIAIAPGGCSDTGTDIITIIPAPNKPTITVSVTGDSLISSASSDNQWNFNGTPIKDSTRQILIIKGHSKGWYSVTVTNLANGCTTTSDSTTSVDVLSMIYNQLSIYPNPFNTAIFIKINSSVSSVNTWSLFVTDVLGRTLYSRLSLSYSNDLNLADLPGGVYFISVVNNTSRAVFPIVKQN